MITKTKSKPNLSLLLRRTAKRLGKSEAEILSQVKKVATTVSNQISFGYFDKEDIEQEGLIIGISALSLYDFERPLENFLYTSIKNRILNLQRKLLTRTDPPCLLCHQVINGHSGHADGKTCESYRKWYKLNFTKRSLMEPMELEERPVVGQDTVGDSAELKDILVRIDTVLPIELRSTYLRMRAGENVSADLKEKVESFVREFLYKESDDEA